MSGSWYLYNGHEREGPLTHETLINRLKGFRDLSYVSVWCPGYEDWEPADRVFNLAPSERPASEVAPRRPYMGKFAFYGLLVGVAICLSDYFLQWRGSQFSPWEGDGIAENIGYIAGVCGASTVIGFIVGFLREEPKSGPKSLNPLDSRALEPGPVTSSQGLRTFKSIRYTNFIARNWRGEYSLAPTYWGFGFLGNLAAGLIPVLTAAVLPSKSGYDPRVILVSMTFAWLGAGAIGIWQMVAVWRSANRHINARVALGKKSPWAGLAKLLVILGFMRLAGEFLNSGIPQLSEASRMAFLNDPGIPAYSIRVMRNGTEAEIVGGFKYGLTEDFAKIFSASPQIKVLHLDSLGGRIGEATRLNKLIRENGLTTYVSDGCYSACTVAFAGGRTRILRNGAKLGFHAPTFPGMSKRELQDVARDQERLFAAAGFDSNFVEKALSTPNDKVWTPTAEELLAAKVITGISDGSDFAVSGLGAYTTKDQLASKLATSAPILVFCH